MAWNGYKLKFELHAGHSNIRGDKSGTHNHTFSIILYLEPLDDILDLYSDMEKTVNGWLDTYQNTDLATTALFADGDTTLESIAMRFYEALARVVSAKAFSLLRLEIYETPVRTFAVTKELYDSTCNRVHALSRLCAAASGKAGEADGGRPPEETDTGVRKQGMQKPEIGEAEEDLEGSIHPGRQPEETDTGGRQPESGESEEDSKESTHAAADDEKEFHKENKENGTVMGITGKLGQVKSALLMPFCALCDSKRKGLKILAAVLFLLCGAAALMGVIAQSGIYPRGSDTLNHLYRARLVYEGIKEGNWYILYDPGWYNGIELMRYWAPVPLYMIAGCLFVTGGGLMQAYILFVGVLFCIGAAGFLMFGIRYNRIALSVYLGAAWFLLPDNMRVLFAEGNLPRAVVAAFLPFLLFAIWQFLEEQRYGYLIPVMLLTALTALCHLMIAAMVGITTFLFVCFDSICNKRLKNGILLLIGMVLSFLPIGIWLVPALKGGLMGMSEAGTAQVMKDFFADGFQSLNPVIRYSGGTEIFYYGFAVFVIGLLGVLFVGKKEKAGFLTGLFLFFSTTNSMYAIYSQLPFHQFFWMIRFIPVALGFTFMAVLLWKKTRFRFVALLCVLLLVDLYPAKLYLYEEPESRVSDVEAEQMQRAERYGITKAKSYTRQRMALFDLSSYGAFAAYMITAVEPSRQYTFGWAWQGAATAENIVQINGAYEDGDFYYMFDRCKLLGNDTILMRINLLPNQEDDVDSVCTAANACGYFLRERGDDYLIYTLDTELSGFGTTSSYEAAAIGTGSADIARLFPAFREYSDPYLDHYSKAELSKYRLLYLSGFSCDDYDAAQSLIRELAQEGVHVVIDMNHIPQTADGNHPEFLSVQAQSITLSDSFGTLSYEDKAYRTDAFAGEDTSWNTVYLTGLSNVTGQMKVGEKTLAFAGNAKGLSNVTFLGMNLPYYLQQTKDESVGMLLEEIFDLKRTDLPERTLVPLEISYEKNMIRISSARDAVNTSLAFYDIFDTEDTIYEDWNLLCVDRGTTEIKLRYPYLKQGAAVSIVGMIIAVCYLLLLRSYRKKESLHERENEKDTESKMETV